MRQIRSIAGYGFLCWILALLTHCSGLYEPMHTDYSCRLRIARDWRGGAALYRETYCNTQPIVYMWILASDSSNPAVSSFLAETALATLASIVLWRALRKRLPTAAPVVPLLLIVFSGVSTTFYGGQITEGPAMWCDVLGFSLFAMALQRRSAPLAFLAGVFYLFEVGFRIPSAINAAACFPLLWEQRRRPQLALKLSAAAIAGALVAMACFACHGWAYGYWTDFVGVFQRNLAYGSLNRTPLSASLISGATTIVRIHLSNLVPLFLLVVSFTTLFWRRGDLRRAERIMLAASAIWLLAALISAFPGGRHYDHYYHLCWPAMSIAGCLWLGPLRRQLADKRFVIPLRVGLIAGALLAGMFIQLYAGAKAVRDYHTGGHAWNDIQAAQDYVAKHIDPDEPVMMNLWGDGAELYWRAKRPSPGLPVPHVVPRALYPDWTKAMLANPPRWIITDDTPLEPIDGPVNSVEQLRVELLQSQIEAEYQETQRHGAIRILKRN